MQPTLSTLKRLFACCGNRCAFPNCTAPVVHNETLLGEVCHIKGEKLGSARYDSNQSAEERRAYENLIVLCPTHHTVIDDDQEAYTFDRIARMKATHEAHAKPMEEQEAARVAEVYLQQNAHNIGQNGGLSAHTIHAHSIHVAASAPPEPLTLRRQMQAIEKLWDIICRLRKEFGDLVFVDTVLTRKEIANCFAHGDWPGMMSSVQDYGDYNALLQKLKKSGCDEADAERPFISPRLWTTFYIIRAVHGRMAYLFEQSFLHDSYRDWREDNGIDQLVRYVLPANVVEQLKKLQVHGLQSVIDHLEAQFLEEAKMRAA